MTKLRITTDVDVDLTAWAAEYGLEATEALDDALEHIGGIIDDVVAARAEALGTFAPTGRPAVTLLHDSAQAGMRAPYTKWGGIIPAPSMGPFLTDDPRVRVGEWSRGNWRTAIEYDDGWDITGPPFPTKEAALASVPDVVRRLTPAV